MKKKLLLVLVVVLMQSCFENNDNPTAFLKDFVRKTTKGIISQSDYKSYIKGELLSQIENLSEEEFKNYEKQLKVKNIKINILNENCKETKCTITYITKYSSKASDGSEYATEVRKIAELEKEDSWKLVSVENVKTYHETNNALNPLED